LLKAHLLIQDWYRDGIPIWVDESERVTFDAKPKISKSRAAVDRAQEAQSKKKKSTPGLYFIPVPKIMDGGPMPTREEWLEEQERKQGFNVSSGDSRGNILQGKK